MNFRSEVSRPFIFPLLADFVDRLVCATLHIVELIAGLIDLILSQAANPDGGGLLVRTHFPVSPCLESQDSSALRPVAAREPSEQRQSGCKYDPSPDADGFSSTDDDGSSKGGERLLYNRLLFRTVVGPGGLAQPSAIAGIEGLGITSIFEYDLVAVGRDDGVTLVPIVGAAGLVELGDVPAGQSTGGQWADTDGPRG
jgi:hypothetical protein